MQLRDILFALGGAILMCVAVAVWKENPKWHPVTEATAQTDQIMADRAARDAQEPCDRVTKASGRVIEFTCDTSDRFWRTFSHYLRQNPNKDLAQWDPDEDRSSPGHLVYVAIFNN